MGLGNTPIPNSSPNRRESAIFYNPRSAYFLSDCISTSMLSFPPARFPQHRPSARWPHSRHHGHAHLQPASASACVCCWQPSQASAQQPRYRATSHISKSSSHGRRRDRKQHQQQQQRVQRRRHLRQRILHMQLTVLSGPALTAILALEQFKLLEHRRSRQ